MLIWETDRQTLRGVLVQSYTTKRNQLSSWADRKGAGTEAAENGITQREVRTGSLTR